MSDGIEIDHIWCHCPVMAEGTIDGEPFFFRARYQWWSIDVGTEESEWVYEEKYSKPGEFAAGWMDHAEVPALIEKAAAMWRARPPS